jgi:hypothetical protein
MKHKIIKQCWADKRPFRYMDSGYLGNRPGPKNPHGWKVWHRIVPNNLQHDQVIPRASDRWNQLGLEAANRRGGSQILIVAPDEKPCKFYDIELDTWLAQTVATIKQHTDRPIEIRLKRPRAERLAENTMEEALADDVYCLVTYNSVAAVEAVMLGKPAITLGPNAAAVVSNTQISDIEKLSFPDDDLREAWLRHLSYSQFTFTEMSNGTAWKILNS